MAIVVVDLKDSKHPSQIGEACREHGFFYIKNHGVEERLQERLLEASQRFFALPLEKKMEIEMAKGGRAWRGYFPVGGELTSELPDMKEGIYFGIEGSESPVPLHGPNLFPTQLPEMKSLVLEYTEKLTQLGHGLMKALSLSLKLEEDYFFKRYTKDPLTLFRIFHYPPNTDSKNWGVGEHTDYGVLTILRQDAVGGLEIRTKTGWVAAPPIPGTFICNIGDMLDRMTGGLYRSTPHRVRNTSSKSRLSLPFFFDPGFHVEVKPLPLKEPLPADDKDSRWDKTSVHAFQGTYGEYLLGKVSRVFPQLKEQLKKH